ncbi:MAG: GxxExxY protein [Anaerolineae bacterium]|nr:GxxExxY protein [Candidatus Roseilinea sp.]MDW8450954.1 GxxExxY protein [Anaerolineae bacterium]
MSDKPVYLHQELTHAIIGAAMTVHSILGGGFLESVYHEALAYELRLRGITFEREIRLLARYKDIVAGESRADFIVDDKVVVEIKAVSALTKADEAQIIHYLKATGKRVGLFINFGRASLEYRRFVL